MNADQSEISQLTKAVKRVEKQVNESESLSIRYSSRFQSVASDLAMIEEKIEKLNSKSE